MVEHVHKTVNVINKAGTKGIPFVLTYIGAAIYFVQQSNGQFFEVIFALLQALIWPAYVVYHILKLLGA